MNGKQVVLRQGKDLILEAENPCAIIKKYSMFPEINIIDLDAAFGNGSNMPLIKELAKISLINVGGGIRDLATAKEYLGAGVKNLIIGTKADEELLNELPINKIIVALDIRDDKVQTHGWTQSSNYTLKERIKSMEKYCHTFLITNIHVEGLGKGIDKKFVEELKGLTKNRIIIAGGVASYDDIAAIENYGFDVILGRALYDGTLNITDAVLNILKFTDELIPTVVKDQQGKVLMAAYSNNEAIKKTIGTGKCHYYSRSRKQLWLKGQISGNAQRLVELRYDCDRDTLLYIIEQHGNACHLGRYSCFNEDKFSVQYLIDFLHQRINEKGISYTKQIGTDHEKLSKKLLEEAFEVSIAKTRDNKVYEVTDLFFFILLYMAKEGISFKEIINELKARHKVKL